MEGADEQIRGRGNPALHFKGGFISEGDGEDAVRRHLKIIHYMLHAAYERVRFSRSGARGDKQGAARVAHGLFLSWIQFFVSMYHISTIAAKITFLKNKTVLAAIFCLIVSAANMAFGGVIAGQYAAEQEGVLGGPAASAFENGAMIGAGNAQEEYKAEEVMVYSASVTAPGQSVFEIIKGVAETITGIFSMPARGINWGKRHAHNAVDIAGRCGSALYAAAPGKVVEVRAGWNGGYGNYVDIDHGGGVVTRYAHTESNLVAENQMVAAGDVIARMGNTGDSTGCHVHFEVRGGAGAPNPFIIR